VRCRVHQAYQSRAQQDYYLLPHPFLSIPRMGETRDVLQNRPLGTDAARDYPAEPACNAEARMVNLREASFGRDCSFFELSL
jgi:hypothetical protein